MGFFQPGDATGSSAQTPAPAQQALAKFKADILGQLLNSMGGQRPTFASFAKGGPATNPMPQGLGGGITALLAAMNQPGAFTSTGSTKTSAGSPSMLSDIVQMGVLAAMLGNVLGGGQGAGATSGAGLGNLASGLGNLGSGIAGWFGSGSPTADSIAVNTADPALAGVNYSTESGSVQDALASWFASS